MSRARFLADHDLNEHIVDGALRRGPTIGFVRARDVGPADRPDAEFLDYAAGQGLLVESRDVNTMPAQAQAQARTAAGRPMPGLLMVHQGQPIGAVSDSLLLIWSASEAEEWLGLVTFSPL